MAYYRYMKIQRLYSIKLVSAYAEGKTCCKSGIISGCRLEKWEYIHTEGQIEKCWSIGSESYVKEAIKIIESQIKRNNLRFTSTRRNGRQTSFSKMEHWPVLDCTGICDNELPILYENLISQ